MTERRQAEVIMETPHSSAGPPTRSRPRLGWALAGTLLALGLLLLDVRASGHGILRPIRAGARGPSAAVVAKDFPHASVPDEVGFDGQQFYAMARDPFHPDAVAPSLDNARYRYQRPLYPLLAWALHPSGGGAGLIYALVAVSLFGLLIGAVALGMLGDDLGGPRWLPLLYPLLPGSVWTFTSSVADGLAVSLSLVTIVAFRRGRFAVACIAAVAAALTRETTILVPLALVLADRRKRDVPLVALPGLAFAAWLVVVRLTVPAGGIRTERPVLPLTGLVHAVTDRWMNGQELIGMAATLGALAVGTYVLLRRRGPTDLRWIIALHLAFLSICSGGVLGDDYGSTRSTFMLLVVALAALVSTPLGPTPLSAYLSPSVEARTLRV